MAQILVLLPPIIAIGLALLTKEVYSSLFIGVVVGAFIFVLSGGVTTVDGVEMGYFLLGEQHAEFAWNFSLMGTAETTLNTVVNSVADPYNVGILLFLVLLGMLVSVITKAGGSKAYGNWAASKIKGKKAALLSTSALGVLIFIDDYFNCLTVGTVMKPVTDKFKISRAKLSYIIDSTAAPVCIIAPVSSWGAAITSCMSMQNPFQVFLQTIPFNFYALLTIIFLVSITLLKEDYGLMKKLEDLAEQKGELGSIETIDQGLSEQSTAKGTVWDLIIPIVVLIIGAILGMIYTGNGFDGSTDIMTAFTNCDAPTSLNYGAFAALICTAIMYLPRKIIKPREFMEGLTQGFKAMVPAITILALAWSLGGICKNSLMLGNNISVIFEGSNIDVILPAVLFILGSFIGFSTGTSWGTMAILIPLAEGLLGVVGGEATTLTIITVAAVAAGAVLGDHISPISDTTIMASTGAQCDHLQHVTSQIPYALTVGAVSVVAFLIAGITSSLGFGLSLLISWIVALVGLFGVLFFIKFRQKKHQPIVSSEAEVK